MLELAKHLGSSGAGGLIVLGFSGLAAAMPPLVRRWLPWLQVDREYSDFGQIFGGAIGTMFALVFALVTIANWQNYDRVANDVASEANCLHNIDRYLDFYPPALRDPAKGLIRAYLGRLVQNEWPLLAKGGEDPEARRLITEFDVRLAGYRPATLGELPLHQEMLTQVSVYRTLRHGRLDAGRAYLDAGMWVSLAIGSATLLGFGSVWRVPDRRQHLILMLALGASLGVVFFLLLTYNHPFKGPEAIGPAPFQDFH